MDAGSIRDARFADGNAQMQVNNLNRVTDAVFCVPDVSRLRTFYADALGMDCSDSGDEVACGYPESAGCTLRFTAGPVSAATAASDSVYWKTGIVVPNLDAAVAHLRSRGLRVSEPAQFRDIGYLAHLHDPNGLTIELLQQRFEHAAPAPSATHTDHPFRSATVAHITLRSANLEALQRYFEFELGMRCMSIQPVLPHDFCLYFYAWSDEVLPDPDLTSVANREWLWARPYTLIEIQHMTRANVQIRKSDQRAAGLLGLHYSTLARPEAKTYVAMNQLETNLDAR